MTRTIVKQIGRAAAQDAQQDLTRQDLLPTIQVNPRNAAAGYESARGPG